MNVFETYIRDRYEAVSQELCDTEREVADRIADAQDPSAQLAEYASARAAVTWWNEVVTQIDHECADPVDALAKARESARRTLTDHAVPRHACPFAQGFAVARVEAARRFYRDTAHMDALTAAAAPRRGM